MNIGIFSDTYLPQVNGVVSSIVTLEKQLIAQGHNVFIFTISHPKASGDADYVYRLPSMPFVFLKDHRVGILYSPNLIRKIKKLKLDVILSQTEFSLGFFARLASKQLRIPIIHTYHTMYEEYVHYISKGVEFSPEFARKYSKNFCNHVDGIVAPTEKTRRLLLSYGVNTPISVIPTGIDFKPFNPANYTPEEVLTLKDEFKLTMDMPVILFIGRVAKEKSIDTLIEALPKVLIQSPSAKLVIIGDGPELDNLRELASSRGLEKSVIFAGMRPWKEIGKYYQLGDVFVSASTSETQGLTFAEAMAAHLPVVAKRDESVEGLIKSGVNGILFESGDELSDALIGLLSNKKNQLALGEQASLSIYPLSDEIFGQNASAYYEEIIALKKEKAIQKRLNRKQSLKRLGFKSKKDKA